MPTDVRDVLHELSVPPESPEFFDELRERMHEHDRAHARRWRRASVGVAVAVAAITAAGVFAAARSGGGSTLERTVSCATTSATVQVNANATFPKLPVASASVSTGKTALFSIDTMDKGFVLGGSRCRPAAARIPLARAGLPSEGVYSAGAYRGLMAYCTAPGRVFLRFRVHLDSAGRPENARIAVWGRSGRTKPLRPLAFLQWSAPRLLTYVSSRCTTQ